MFYDKFVELCSVRRISPTAASKEIGFAKSNLTAWKNGIAEPNTKLAVKIADYFGVTTDYLFEKETKKAPPITDDELELIMKMRTLSTSHVEQVKTMVDFLKSQYK